MTQETRDLICVMRGRCSGYLCLRVVLGSLDTASDLLLCAHLLLEQHTAWAAIVGGKQQ